MPWPAEHSRTPEHREWARRLGLASRTHGATRPDSPLFKTYRSWQAMKRRCDKPTDSFYARYGGRGIAYDQTWAAFEPFLADMGPRPEGTTLDRIDNDGPYVKSNCRWATLSEQRRNRIQPSGWKQRPLIRPKVYGTRTIACKRCGADGTVSSVVSQWVCPACRPARDREATAKWKAKAKAAHS